MPNVVIFQEYVPHYRAPFFSGLRDRAAQEGIDLTIACGHPRREQALRSDSADLDFTTSIEQREWSVFGRRLVLRKVSDIIPNADLVIIEQARRNIDAYQLLGARRQKGPRIALWGHGRDYTKKAGMLERSVQKWLTLRADWFFSYTAGGIAAVTGFGFPESRTTLVQNSTDTLGLRNDIEAITEESKHGLIMKHGLSEMTAIFVGALDESKRLPFLIEAARRVYEIDPRFRLLIMGDGHLRSRVEGWAIEYSWLTYLGTLTGVDKARALACSQILTMPGRVGLVAVDSFAAALPIVTTDWQWHAPEFEYLVSGMNAVITLDDVDAFATGILATLHDAKMLKLLKAACSVASKTYTIRAMVENFVTGMTQALAVER